jgi:tetratricopeptide (TPR) repeat protein
LNPRYIQGRGWYALFYLQFSEGKLSEGMAEAKLALASDPLSSYVHSVYGFTCAHVGNYGEAVREARRGVELDSESYLSRMVLQGILHTCGELEESATVGKVALAMSGRIVWSLSTIAITCADLGKRADAEAIYAEMLARARHEYVSPAHLAYGAIASSREDAAIDHAREAFAIRDPSCQVFFSKWLAYSKRLYACPRFVELLADMGFG